MSRSLAIFRGSSRLEYRNQNIKLLRAVEGEYTRSSYRLLWVTDDAFDLLGSESNPIATTMFVDPAGTAVFPVRQLMVVDHTIDAANGSLDLTFEIGPFVAPRLDFREELREWRNSAMHCPPDRFVSVWQEDWPALDELPRDVAVGRWREAIDFLTSHWDMRDAAFLRLAEPLDGSPDGPRTSAVESRETLLRIHSYNPHLRGERLKSLRLRVLQSGGLAAIEAGDDAALDRDGEMDIRLRCLEPGSARIDINVHPDPQFSTYLPVTIDVERDPEFTSGRPRLLGKEWQACLEGLETHLVDTPDLHLTILELLGRAFADDPSVLQHKGRVHYRLDHLAEARQFFDQAMTMREDASTVAWNLFAALKRGDVADGLELLTKLNLSQHHLFDELLVVVEQLPEPVALSVARVASEVFGHDKALKLLEHLSANVSSESAVSQVAMALAKIDAQRALVFLMNRLTGHDDWPEARRLVVDLAEETDRVDGIEEHAIEALRWKGEAGDEFRARWHRYRRFLTTPDIRLALLIRNARQLFDAGIDDLASEFAIDAAEIAVEQGDLLTAQSALTLIFSNRTVTTPDYIVDTARSIESHIGEVLTELAPVRPGSEEYITSLYRRLRPWTEGKTLAVLGMATRHPVADEWESELRARVVWLTSTPSSPVNEERLRAFEPSSLIVIELWESMGHLKSNTKSWLKENQVPRIPAHAGRASVLEALNKYFPKLDDASIEG